MKRNLKRISLLLAVVLLVGCMAALSACTASSGTALKFVSATVNRSSVRTDYYVGEEVDFSGIRLRVRYNDALQSVNADLSMLKFELDGEDITEDLSVLTAEAGEKELSILYFDGLVDNEWKRATLTVRVTEAPVVVYDGVVSSFSAPAARRAFEAAAQEGDGQYVGAQNPFFFLPEYTVEDPENGEEIAGAVLPLEIGLALASEEDGEPAALERREAGKNAVAFYDGETLIAEADIRSGRFSFTEEAIGLALDLSVAPPAAYAYEGEPLTALLLIVDAYNVYDARELCLLDNANGRNHLNAAVGYADWQVFKETYGYADISVR